MILKKVTVDQLISFLVLIGGYIFLGYVPTVTIFLSLMKSNQNKSFWAF